MFRAALKSLLGHKLRLAITTLAVVLGVSFMAGTFVLTDTISKSFDDLFSDANAGLDAIVQGEEAVESTGPAGPTRADLDLDLVEQVQAVDGVEDAEPVVFGFTTILQDGKAIQTGGGPLFGSNWTGVPEVDVFQIAEGREPRSADEAVVDRTTAGNGGFRIGSPIEFQTRTGVEEATVVGIATFGESNNLAGAGFLLLPTDAALEAFSTPGRVQQISVVADDGISETEIVGRVSDAVGGSVDVITAAQSTEDSQEQFGAFVDQLTVVLNGFAAVSLVAGAFLIYNTFGIIVAQRVRELALLRALGANRRQVLGSVIVEAAAIGLVASLIGVVGGIVLATALKALFSALGVDLPGLAPVVAPRTIVVSLAVGLIITLVSAVVPAWRASRVAPMAALRDVAFEKTGASLVRVVIGIVVAACAVLALVRGASSSASLALLGTLLIFAAVIVLGPVIVPFVSRVLGAPLPRLVGVPGQIARDNTVRNPKRSASTASALTLSVAIVTLLSVFFFSFGATINRATDDFLLADVEVSAGGFAGPTLGPDLVADIKELPDVDAASGVQIGSIQLDGDVTSTLGLSLADVTRLWDLGDTEGSIAGLGADEVAVETEKAETEGWRAGDVLPVVYPDGASGTLRVGALYESAGIIAQDEGGSLIVSSQVFVDHFPATSQFLSRVTVKGAEGTGTEALKRSVERATESFPTAEVQDKDEIKEEQNNQILLALGLVLVLLMLAVVIGGLGIANTLALSVFERTREIGLVRAVGATRRQVATSVTIESILLTLFGTIMGLLIGTAGGVALVRNLEGEIPTATVSIPWFFVVLVVLISLALGVGASVIPAWRSARMNVLDAVSVE